MTPLYDVLSAWPIIGHGKNQLAIEKAKLAMSLRGRRAHYRLNEITARPWQELAGRTADRDLWRRIQSFVEAAPAALERVDVDRDIGQLGHRAWPYGKAPTIVPLLGSA